MATGLVAGLAAGLSSLSLSDSSELSESPVAAAGLGLSSLESLSSLSSLSSLPAAATGLVAGLASESESLSSLESLSEPDSAAVVATAAVAMDLSTSTRPPSERGVLASILDSVFNAAAAFERPCSAHSQRVSHVGLGGGAAWRVAGGLVCVRACLLHEEVVDHGVVGAHRCGLSPANFRTVVRSQGVNSILIREDNN